MKNLIIIVLLSIMFFSCDMAIINDFWYIDKGIINEEFESSIDIDLYVYENITYTLYNQLKWQTPHETQKRKKGDCEDESIFELALNYHYLNKKGQLLLVDSTGDGKINHCMYKIDGEYYNKSAEETSFRILYTYEFEEIPYLTSANRN